MPIVDFGGFGDDQPVYGADPQASLWSAPQAVPSRRHRWLGSPSQSAQPAGPPAAPAAAASPDWTTGAWDPSRVSAYYQSRHVTPRATSPGYWAGKWQEWGQKDPAYFLQRLSQAEEFGGGGAGGDYSDPASQQWQRYLQEQSGRLSQQRLAQERANVGLRQQMAEAKASADRLTKFMTARAAKLQGPAYTGPEQEILRTQQLDPLERDRQAARQRALQNISARGFAPESGIAQELMNQVDQQFNQQRARAQGELGYRQVAEQRSREQEAQQLLGMIPQLQRAGAGGDLAFLEALNAAVNRPEEARVGLEQAQYLMPQDALQQALMALGVGPSQGDLFNQAMGLYGIQQQNRNQGLSSYQSIGQAIPWILNGRF